MLVDAPAARSLWDAFRKGGLATHGPKKEASDATATPDFSSILRNPYTAGDSPPRQVFVTPYVPFDKGIPASDITAINSQQSARNAAFMEWIAGISNQIEKLGYSTDVTFDQTPDDWYVSAVTAKIHIAGGGPELTGRLTLYHYDAWQGLDAASLALQLVGVC